MEEAVADLSPRSRAGSFGGTQALVWVQSCLGAGRSPTGEHRNEGGCCALTCGKPAPGASHISRRSLAKWSLLWMGIP